MLNCGEFTRCAGGRNEPPARGTRPSDELPKFVAIDEPPEHHIAQAFRLRKADRATHQPLDPRPQIEVFALNFLCMLLAYLMFLRVSMTGFFAYPPIRYISAIIQSLLTRRGAP